jgi:DNA polymerase I
VDLSNFPEIWFAFFEYEHDSGENPRPSLLEAMEVKSGRSIVLDHHQLQGLTSPPLPAVDDGLIVTYDAPALLGCFLSLGWNLPHCILDLHAEFRCHVSGLNERRDLPFSLALSFYGAEGDAGQIAGLKSLLEKMLPILDLRSALQRGRYTRAVANMERVGIPIDKNTLEHLRCEWGRLRLRLIKDVDRHYGVFDRTTFRERRWEQWIEDRGISWLRLESGDLALDDDTFKSMARAYPNEVSPMWELRKTLNQ